METKQAQRFDFDFFFPSTFLLGAEHYWERLDVVRRVTV